MPAAMLASQLATLEPPAPEEHAIAVDTTQTPRRIVSGLLARSAR